MARILLDVDGVVANFVGSYLRVVKDVTGRDYGDEDVVEWNIASALGLSEQEQARVHEVVATPGFCLELSVYPGAVAAVRRLAGRHSILWVTTPSEHNPTWRQDRQRWLARHFGELGASLVQTSDKQLVDGDLLVDDRPENCAAWARAHPAGLAVLWSRPWNVSAVPAGICRAASWDEVDFIAQRYDDRLGS
jgi:5'(3')-deoxyribonucleotidase